MTGSALEATGLAIGFAERPLAAGLSLRLEPGTVTCLLGPNGVGKTTLFRTLLGLLPPLAGTIRLDGHALSAMSIGERARRLAYVPQAGDPSFAYSALDMVVMGRTAHLGAYGTPRRADIDIARSALARLGLAGLAERDFARLSGGQRQLVLVARALAQQAGIILMDEPTASLDFANRLRVLNEVRALAGGGAVVLMSTHDPEQAFAIADHVALLGPDGHFSAGAPDEILTGETLSRLYGVTLQVEVAPSGRRVVAPIAWSRASGSPEFPDELPA